MNVALCFSLPVDSEAVSVASTCEILEENTFASCFWAQSSSLWNSVWLPPGPGSPVLQFLTSFSARSTLGPACGPNQAAQNKAPSACSPQGSLLLQLAASALSPGQEAGLLPRAAGLGEGSRRGSRGGWSFCSRLLRAVLASAFLPKASTAILNCVLRSVSTESWGNVALQLFHTRTSGLRCQGGVKASAHNTLWAGETRLSNRGEEKRLLLRQSFLGPHRRQPTRRLCPWDPPGKNTGVSCHFLLQCMKVKSLSCVWLFTTHGL